MKNIVLTRIDDRLIHGQVVTAWVKQFKVSRIVIVDDPLTKDAFMMKILKAAAPPQISVEVQSAAHAVEILNGEPENGENILILVKIPQVLESLIDSGVRIKRIILGGMGAKAGRKKFTKNVSASEDEVACMRRIVEKGTEMQYQLVPDERPVNISKFIN
jgi:Phosphotransferase system, mannose/fructose/N-acetylgalactosamine-specific component IIB